MTDHAVLRLEASLVVAILIVFPGARPLVSAGSQFHQQFLFEATFQDCLHDPQLNPLQFPATNPLMSVQKVFDLYHRYALSCVKSHSLRYATVKFAGLDCSLEFGI